VDYELPDGTGLDLARELRGDQRHAKTPILLYAASLNNELAFEAMQVDINDSLAKPMDMLDLRSRSAQLVELPEIKTVQRELLQLTCMAWTIAGQYHEYSPDLNLHLQSADRDQVRAKMHEALERKILSKSNPSQDQIDVSVVKHIINLCTQPAKES
jgi:CheY-like chemotaxis protein